jgi:hypothetical protein
MREDFHGIGTISDTFSSVVNSNILDSKNRLIGFNVELWDFIDLEGEQTFYAKVQQVRNGKDFGNRQRGSGFATQEKARDHGYRIARERIAKANWTL